MHDFIPGQRWVNYAELQLGLGTVLSVDLRTVTLLFLASGETRTYSMQTAPLTRVVFASGDRIRSHEGRALTVVHVNEEDGLLTYSCTDDAGDSVELPEGSLDSHLQLNRPAERLFTGQVDQDRYREEARQNAGKLDLRYEEIPGSKDLVIKMINGPWDDDFVIARPGEKITFQDFKLTGP